MSWLLEQGLTPEVIPNGSLLMSIYHKTLNIRVIDSLNFLPMALAKLPQCFGLTELKKGFFPHLFNTRENQTYVGPLPKVDYYRPDTMMPSVRKAFLSWYEEHKDDEFDFQAEILAYCRSDVDILRRCCLAFRSQFLNVSNVDPFRYVTIASACMAVYRNMHIKPETISMVPVYGYTNKTNYSVDGIRWLDYVAYTENIKIQHALNGYGECKIGGVSVDGFCEEKKTIYQFHKCGSTSLSKKKKTSDTLKTFLETHGLQDRLNPRDAFFGGRTNAVKLYYEGSAKYVDFTSLYPWVNKYCVYPVGHPKIITENFEDIEKYFGIVKCRIIPPRELYLPVLPHRCNGKLLFPLCRSCAENLQQSTCRHTPEERALIGTWVAEEVKLAIRKGYQVTNVYEVYHFEETSTSLFKSYIDLFLKIKQESSGWPAECRSEEQKESYIKEYLQKEGIRLDSLEIAKNPGRRQVAKLALNSFWGRWGMNINKVQLTFVNSVPQFNKILHDSTKNVKDVCFPNEEVAAIWWEKTDKFVSQDTTTNVFLAAFTTAWARLKLYSEMEKLDRAVLYHDTDSIIYAQDGNNDPPIGNFLGEFTDELDGDTITKFVSGGPKNYAFETEAGKTCCKVRGFTLNFRNSQLLNFESVKSLVCSLDPSITTIEIENPMKICREAKRRKVVNKVEKKLYRVVYDKRVIQSDLTTLPYGY
ncbi:uncharacterized protein LOC118198678 [Stegodyphus dumicola]|uniref:uncharacterized protein LOC118198678 n=1 Tax=Stegodyphus dumicola TaxID=202533 RepID=UPI0015AC0E57|nr:uncharacterized protein LOC118198678 [Stegodyphus dumicola]